jgi:hypothetical protein
MTTRAGRPQQTLLSPLRPAAALAPHGQIRTFRFAAAAALLVPLLSIPLTLVIIGFGSWVMGVFVLGVRAIHRIARGWMRLNAHPSVPAKARVNPEQVQSRLRRGFQSSWRGRFRRLKSFAPTDWCTRNG